MILFYLLYFGFEFLSFLCWTSMTIDRRIRKRKKNHSLLFFFDPSLIFLHLSLLLKIRSCRSRGDTMSSLEVSP